MLNGKESFITGLVGRPTEPVRDLHPKCLSGTDTTVVCSPEFQDALRDAL
jgi:hypothetical protein